MNDPIAQEPENLLEFSDELMDEALDRTPSEAPCRSGQCPTSGPFPDR
ncbi:MAG: hypothetical protein AB7M05_13145 [Alphaproteobacteria bacterium]